MTVTSLDLTLPTPAENLACDEWLLEERVALGPEAPGVLRFWESAQPFVVLGFANQVAQEVQMDACRTAGVPVLRRCSGGGTVLQGPGCLNYALVLPVPESGLLATITGANRFIMERHRAVLDRLAGPGVTVEGHTDLALQGRKFSGNAQRRRRDWLLFHGTFLLQFDLELIGHCLRPPPRAPEYRGGRNHADFLTTLKLPRPALQAALVASWQAATPAPAPGVEAIRALARSRYETDAWNFSR